MKIPSRKVKSSLTKHPPRPHRTPPRTDKYHRWTFPSGRFQPSPLLLRMTERDGEKGCLEHRNTSVPCSQVNRRGGGAKKYTFPPQCSLEQRFAILHMNLKSPLKSSPPAFPYPEAAPIACLISPIIPSIHIDLYGFRLLFRAAGFLALGFGGTWRYRSQPYGGLGTPWVHITLHEQLRGAEITGGKKKKQSGQSQIAFYYQRNPVSARFAILCFPLGPFLH